MNYRNNGIVIQLQSELEKTDIDDFYEDHVDKYHNMLLLGSRDFSYYHELEVVFYGVTFICCPLEGFIMDCFRIASEEEVTKLEMIMHDSWEGCIIALEDSSVHTSYYIVAERVEYNFQLVKYYDDLGKCIKGGTISDWARTKLNKV